jgi:tetratricopeptide (TPR) repeat protein
MVQGDVLYMRGYALLSAGRLEEAKACWTAIHGDLAPLKQAFNNIGSALAESGMLAEAVPFFERARDEDPRYTLGLRNEALVLRNLGDKPRSIELLQRLVELDPEQREARLQLASLLDEEDQPIEALAQYEALAAADPKDPAPWRDAGELLARRGDRTKAREAFREALRLAPGDSRASDGLDRLQRGDDLFQDQLAGLTESIGDEGELGPAGVSGPPIPVLPRDPLERPGFEPVLGGATAPR